MLFRTRGLNWNNNNGCPAVEFNVSEYEIKIGRLRDDNVGVSFVFFIIFNKSVFFGLPIVKKKKQSTV